MSFVRTHPIGQRLHKKQLPTELFQMEDGKLFFNGEPLRKNSRETIINKYYESYHDCMTAAGFDVPFTPGKIVHLEKGLAIQITRLKGRSIYYREFTCGLEELSDKEQSHTHNQLLKLQA